MSGLSQESAPGTVYLTSVTLKEVSPIWIIFVLAVLISRSLDYEIW